jgi:putative ATPase
MKEIGYGAGYAYDHDAEDGFSGQDYFPEGMKRPVFYAAARTRVRARVEEAGGLFRQTRAEAAGPLVDKSGRLG